MKAQLDHAAQSLPPGFFHPGPGNRCPRVFAPRAGDPQVFTPRPRETIPPGTPPGFFHPGVGNPTRFFHPGPGNPAVHGRGWGGLRFPLLTRHGNERCRQSISKKRCKNEREKESAAKDFSHTPTGRRIDSIELKDLTDQN